LSTPNHRKREEYWIRLLGTATPYGCNDKIDSIGKLSSSGSNSVNMIRLFPAFSGRRRRSHGHRHYSPPTCNLHNFSIDSRHTYWETIRRPSYSYEKKCNSLLLQRLKSPFRWKKVDSLALFQFTKVKSLASFLMSLTTGYTNSYLPIHIHVLQRKESFWTYISLIKD